MEYVRTADDAVQLSDLLCSGTDGRSVVVASVARATGRAYVDEVRLERALGEAVDVYVVSPEAGRVLRRNVPATRHVFGGAAQAYAPVCGGRPVVSGPLRVAFGVADVDRMTTELIRDVTTLVAGPTASPDESVGVPARGSVAQFEDELEDEVDD
ncbi:hypothetical protein [Ruania albidiflava]|uniref:hypothetical protein n=1 Tax=Ruania albidiflava TaxID=366586 RepID=UPI00041ABEB4|nr:hypothetical protein [Ruania albidiflava]